MFGAWPASATGSFSLTTDPKIWDALVVGAGAAGVFAALRARECNPNLTIAVLDRSGRPLRKVAISGGGRCNVTHHCRDLDWLLSCYPRGGPRLEAILGRFMPEDTVAWFEQRGVKLKTEADGRMFPTTNNSATIIDCLLKTAEQGRIPIRCGVRVDRLSYKRNLFELRTPERVYRTRKLLLATGGASKATDWLRSLGHEIVPDIPSLFTFCCSHPLLKDLQGVSVSRVHLKLLTEPEHEAEGPFLITHWGLSGPAVLKLSAFAARELAPLNYRAGLLCDLLPEHSPDQIEAVLTRSDSKQLRTASPFPELVKRLWQRLLEIAQLPGDLRWSSLSLKQRSTLVSLLKNLELSVEGKGAFKEEFVTAGGLPLHEVDPYTMESRRTPGLYVAGELLDVDGITGGFNFQNAWATGYIAGEGLS